MNAVLKWLLGGIVAALAVPIGIGIIQNLPKDAGKPDWQPQDFGKPVLQQVNAWHQVEPHLNRLDQAAAIAADKQLARISAFFTEKKRGIKEFSSWAFGWTAKWHSLKGTFQGDDGAGFRTFLQVKFAEFVFNDEDLQAALESAMRAYLVETQSLENAALVQIKVDIGQDQLFQGGLPQLQTDLAFLEEYRRMEDEVLRRMATDLKVGIAGQLTSFVGSELIAQALGSRLSAQLGITGSGFWSAVGRSGVTIAVGAVAWFAFEYVIDWILQLVGYGPENELTGKVEQALRRIEVQLIDGDPAAVAEYERFRRQQQDDPTREGRLEGREEADRIEQSGALGLRSALMKLQELQSQLRREALRKLVTSRGG